MTIIRIPRKFYDDHRERDLETPPAVKENSRSVWIDTTHPDFAELVSDAKYYAEDTAGWNQDSLHWVYAARRLLTAIDQRTGE